MAKNNELYVSFDEQEYRKGKANVLVCQADLLRVMRYVENLRRLKIEKRRLKIKMAEIFSEVLIDVGDLNTEMPSPKLPKGLEKHKYDAEVETEMLFRSRYDEIDFELREIQNKLGKLNS